MNEDPPNVNTPNSLPPNDVRSFNELLEEANKEIYTGCRVMKKMDFLVRVFQHKCLYGISDVGLKCDASII